MQYPKSSLVLYGLLLTLYAGYTVYLCDQSTANSAQWIHYQPLWLKWSVASFGILMWFWYLLRPDTNVVKRYSLAWGEAYARFCETWGPWVLSGWLMGLGVNTWNNRTFALFMMGGMSLGITWVPVSRLTKLIVQQFSLPLALFVWGWQLWQWSKF